MILTRINLHRIKKQHLIDSTYQIKLIVDDMSYQWLKKKPQAESLGAFLSYQG
ncbi:MAG: hypothetical protein ACJASB_003833 [Shewanella psychromarinicola]|jgi:hypothetical protein|tara:strand:- start:61664 stop:61822 length:159 start_codon:yes stop_codon:yes gene_type:complete